MKHQHPYQIMNDDGNLNHTKRSLYKQPLFWGFSLVAILSLFVLILLMLNDSLTEDASKPNSKAEGINRIYDYKNEHPDHYFGEAAFFRNGFKITVQSVKIDTAKKMNDDAVGVPIVVSVKIKNTSDHTLSLNPYDFDLFDKQGNLYILDSSTFENTQVGMNLLPGKTASFDLIFDGEEGDEHSYTVTYDRAKWIKQKPKK